MGKQQQPKSRLGRGLSSLMNLGAGGEAEAPLGENATVESETAGKSPLPGVRVLDVPIEQISPNPHQPRRRFSDAGLNELAASIRTTGLIQPVVARGTEEGGYELIAGERRWRAAKLAGLSALPVIVRSADPVMQAQMALVENLQRQDLNPIERANAYKSLLDNLGLTQSELADRLGEERSVIGHYVRLLDLAPPVQQMVEDGRLALSHAKVLVGILDPAEQKRLATLVVEQGLNTRNLERLISSPATAAPAGKPASAASTHLADLEKTISRQLGMRVQLKASPGKKRGRIIVHYASLDQFDDLMSRLGLNTD